MSLLNAQEHHFLKTLSKLSFCNPFEPVRIELEEAALGSDHLPEELSAWSRIQTAVGQERPNVTRITERANQLVEILRERIEQRKGIEEEEASLYNDLVTYVLYYQFFGSGAKEHSPKVWNAFCDEHARFMSPLTSKTETPTSHDVAHLYACLHQVRRAFGHIFNYLIGESGPATKLRAQVWQSIFTHDLRRYRSTLYLCMSNFSTLITGPSGAGKELVAQAIGRSQYQVLDPKTGKFKDLNQESFLPINLSALSPTLIESELFGHRKGSFTGANADHVGWLERCPTHGAVFLDEIGELDPAIQVKLLRVVQDRSYSRLGDTSPRSFTGKLIAATNRDLAREMKEGRFREDFYYRLCSDQIEAPSLRDHLEDSPNALNGLINFLTSRTLGTDISSTNEESDRLSAEVKDWIKDNLPPDYAWPGNIRELEQCVRNLLIRNHYQPAKSLQDESNPWRPELPWLKQAAAGELTADELLNHYCYLIHKQRGGYEQAARLLGLDRRTVKSRVTQVSQ